MRKLALSVVVVASSALILWTVIRSGGEASSGDDPLFARTAGPESAADASSSSDGKPLLPVEGATADRAPVAQAAELPPMSEPTAPVPEAVEESGEAAIEVLVMDAARSPIEGAAVQVQGATLDLQAMMAGRAWLRSGSKTNAEGLVSIVPTVDGLVRLVAKANGFATGSSEPFDVAAAAGGERVEIVLTTGGSVVGRLLDIHGAPAADVRISLQLTHWAGSRTRGNAMSMGTTKTLGDGTLLFENVTPGAYNLYVNSDEEQVAVIPRERVTLEVREGEQTVVQFADRLDSFVRVTGVVRRNAEPLTHASISIGHADRSRGYLGKKTKTDKDGRFEIILDEAGAYRFQISAGESSVFEEVEVPQVENHDVTISFETGRLSGRLLDADGAPVEGMEIMAFGSSSEGRAGSTMQSAQSKAGGTFEFLGLPGGTYKLKARTIPIAAGRFEPLGAPTHPLLGSAEVTGLELHGGDSLDDVELQLSAAGAVSGRILDAESLPVGGALIEFQGPTPLDNSLWKADSSGVFLAGGLRPGTYMIRAMQQAQVSPWVSVSATVMTTAPAGDLVLQTGTFLEVEAVSTTESIPDRIYVSLLDVDQRALAQEILQNNRTHLGPILPGTYTLKARGVSDDNWSTSQVVVVDGEPSQKVQLELPE
ncbi:carboxypeptidase regulatory-like domain-containing protein [Saltatorellus ferox]